MADLNGQYRGRPVPTTVLAFPALEDKGAPFTPQTFRDLWVQARQRMGAGEPIPLGDIVLSPEAIACAVGADAALDANGSLAYYLLHGLLHLVGFGHHDDQGHRAMVSEHARLLRAAGITTAQPP
jgi:probable rRNA maturation factor